MYNDLIYIIIGVFALQFIVAFLLGMMYTVQNTASKNREISSVSVIIPYRNEADRMSTLLHAIQRLDESAIAIEFVFVDDHSSDNTNELIRSQLGNTCRILTNQGKGKKEAIRTGVEQAQHDFILTWDADIDVPNSYFKELEYLTAADMWILPVEMKGQGLLARLAAIDFNWIQLLTYFFGRMKKAIWSNGANLLFKKSVFMELDDQRADYGVASGDDMFLTKMFRQKGKNVEASNASGLRVYTPAAEQMDQLVNQRKRWLSKMSDFKNGTTLSLAFYLFILELGLFACIALAIISGNVWWLIPGGIKYVSELIIQQFFKRGRGLGWDLLIVLIHQIFFPFYLVMIAVAKVEKEDRWNH